MRYRASVEINKPIKMVAELFADPNYIGEYQDGFVRKELIRGTAGAKGAVSRLLYAHGKREMVLEEKIIDNSLPDSFEAFYHHQHMDNLMRCRFTALGPDLTRYETEVEYTRIDWLMPRLIAMLFPAMYRKPGEKWMQNFKEFVEKH